MLPWFRMTGNKRRRNHAEDEASSADVAASCVSSLKEDGIANETCVLKLEPPPPVSFLEDLDSEKIIVTLVLFVVFFFLFEPRGSVRASLRRRWRRYRQSTNTPAERPLEDQEIHPNSNHSTGVLTPDAAANALPPPAESVFRQDSSRGRDDEDDDTLGDLPRLRNACSAPSSPYLSSTAASLPLGFLNFPSFNEDDAREESAEDLFAQLWPAIRESPYRRLVLPPACKLVDRPKKKKKQPEKKKAEQRTTEKSKVDEDHPLHRLQSYARQVGYFLRSLLSYDYASAVWWLIHWLRTLIRLRQERRNGQEEEEDDDVSLATHASSIATARVGNAISPIKSPTGSTVQEAMGNTTQDGHLELTPNSPMVGDEKRKDRALSDSDLSASISSCVSLVGDDETSESDVSDSTPGATPPKVPTLKSRGKRKDALQSYRDSTATGKPTLAPKTALDLYQAPITPPPPLQVPFDEHSLPMIKGEDLPSRDRRDSTDLMSYFDAAHSRASLKRMTLDIPVPDRNGYIVGDDFLRSSQTPLLVFVNSRSGPQQGQLLITQLRRLLNPIQVWDLADGGPEKVLESFSVMSRLRILVCGGDGTVSWIISALQKMAMERWPPIAILPLGTGNDLARIHGWGGGYNNESLIAILEQVAESYISMLDRWEMTVENRKGKIKEVKSFINYLGVGVDAQAALQVHMLRESTPKLFFSRAVNKAWYAIFGAEDAIKASHANLPHEITLIADGVEVPLPADSQGIILLNIDSYAGGVPMWSHGTKAGSVYDTRKNTSDLQDMQLRRTLSLDSVHNSSLSKSFNFDRADSIDDLLGFEKSFSEEEKLVRVTACDLPSSCQDGMLDIVSIRGTFHLGQIRVGLSNAQKLCQCKEATIIVRKKTAVQIDGEPWRQTVSTLHVKRKKEQAVMLHRSADESGGVETEFSKLLEWAMEREIIDRSINDTLMREFSRRIETKTRQRRVKSQDNFMLTLKRAILTNSNSSPAFPSSGGPYR